MNNVDGPVFEEPWQAKAFAIAVALHEAGVYNWSEWAEMLGARIATAESLGEGDAGCYYRDWLGALEDMLITLSDQFHLIKLLPGGTSFLYLAADRGSTNLAILRNSVNKHVQALA